MSMTKADYDELVRLRELGQKHVARDADGAIGGFDKKPRRLKRCWSTGNKTDWTPSPIYGLAFVSWNTEPLNIDAAIAEYERAQEPNGCDVCRGTKILSGTFHGVIRVDDETQMEVDSDGDVDFDFCPVCGRNLASPYTEGDTE